MIFTSTIRLNKNRSVHLLTYLAERFTYHSTKTWSENILQGMVLVDGKAVPPQTMVSAGQHIAYDAGEFEEPPADCNYTILYEDQWLLAVNKPGNLLVHRAGSFFKNNLMYQLRCVHHPQFSQSHSIHRLDRNTSGAILIAKSSSVLALLSQQFRNREVLKTYTAFVENPTTDLPHRISAPIERDTSSQNGCRFYIAPGGKEATTDITAIESLGHRALRLTLRPHTGRTHQLRVHCSALGHPIIGDRMYSATRMFEDLIDNYKPVHPLHPRHALHCSQLEFFHPWLDRKFTLSAPLPDDMRKLEGILSGKEKNAEEEGA